jgi:hypothetical protein
MLAKWKNRLPDMRAEVIRFLISSSQSFESGAQMIERPV